DVCAGEEVVAVTDMSVAVEVVFRPGGGRTGDSRAELRADSCQVECVDAQGRGAGVADEGAEGKGVGCREACGFCRLYRYLQHAVGHVGGGRAAVIDETERE